MNLYQLQYYVAMFQICIFINFNRDTGDFGIIEPENSTLPVAPPQGLYAKIRTVQCVGGFNETENNLFCLSAEVYLI